MAKKELRLAVVIYGGASLAVYMHGVSKELTKLVRASKVLHEVGPHQALDLDYAEGPDPRPHDTEAVYFDILREINRRGHFRVVIDVIAGASAGAINGVMMAKALVDDASLDAQTAGWLQQADVEHLGAEHPTRWRKWYLYPFLRMLSFWLPRDIGASPETREKIARLVRSSWFQPPFSGERLCHHFFDALDAMIASRRPGSSLLPPGQRLDVYASVTDLAGYPRAIRLHEELVARETEHAAFCQLTHVAAEPQASDFADDNLPALVWAARASSSYAGAFPPFHHAELRRVLAERHVSWQRESAFLRDSIRARDGTPAWRHFDPAERYFVDGGIVNNKPFVAALQALNHRPSDRQVERCLVYIEPDPSLETTADPVRDLGYLATLRAALSSIPRNQPILDDLNEIVAQDTRVQINRRIIEANRGDIERMVAGMRGNHPGGAVTLAQICELRAAMADQAERAMGLAYHAYVQRRVWRLVDALVRAWLELAELTEEPAVGQAMEAGVAHWWHRDGAADGASDGEAVRRDRTQETFLDAFDVTFRVRRLQFLIRRINRHEDDPRLDERSREALDDLKQRAYDFMAQCYRLRRWEQLDAAVMNRLAQAAGRLPLPADEALSLLATLSDSLALPAVDEALDEAVHDCHQRLASEPLREALLGDYLGFPVYDVLLLAPGSLEGGPDPLTPIRVERISPADARMLGGIFDRLRCRDFMGFVGFFNRDYREHDYLWGRLNGAERVVDLLCAVAGDAIPDPLALKRRLFLAIVERERPRLGRAAAELDRVAQSLR